MSLYKPVVKPVVKSVSKSIDGLDKRKRPLGKFYIDPHTLRILNK